MAAPGVTFRLTGDKELDRLFRTLPTRVQKKVLRKPLREAAKIIHTAAKANAPVATGALRRSLKVRAGRRSRKRKNEVRIVVVTGKDFFQGETFYGAFLEFGFHRGKRGKGNRPFVQGLHYVERAFKAKQGIARRYAQFLIGQGIEKEAGLRV